MSTVGVVVAGACVTVTAMRQGTNHGCAVMSDGTARCWGKLLTGAGAAYQGPSTPSTPTPFPMKR